MTDAVPKVSIVIPSYNGGYYFKECLTMIFKQKFDYLYEVIVVDSGSTDGTLEFLKSYPIKLQQIDLKTFNHGLTRNLGIENAKGQYIVLMTQDAVPANSSWLDNILKSFQDELVAGIYCRQIPREEADVLTKRHLSNWLTNRQDRIISFIENWQTYNELEPLQKLMLCTLDNVCSCIRKSVWHKIPLPRTYFAEDLEWGKKVIEAGYKIVYDPNAAVIHSHNRSWHYEFKRTYLCHRRLYELFRLQTVPSFRKAITFSMLNIPKDMLYVFRNEHDWRRRYALMARIPFLSLSSVFGQYMGARHERLGHKLKSYSGV